MFPQMFPCLPTRGNIVAETKFASREANMFPSEFRNIFAAVGSTLFLTTDFDVMTRASFLDRVITMQLDSKYRRNLDF